MSHVRTLRFLDSWNDIFDSFIRRHIDSTAAANHFFRVLTSLLLKAFARRGRWIARVYCISKMFFSLPRALAFFRVETHVESPPVSHTLWDREVAPTRESAPLFSLYSRFVNRNTRNIPADTLCEIRAFCDYADRRVDVSVDFPPPFLLPAGIFKSITAL